MKLSRLPVIFIVALFTFSSWIYADALIEGRDYEVVSRPFPSLAANKGKIEILEAYSFTCSHCRNFDPIIRAHIKTLKKDTVFRPEHVVWDKQAYRELARISATITQTQTHDILNPLVYKALFQDKIELYHPEIFKKWLKLQKGFDQKKFLAVYASSKTTKEVSRMEQLTHDFDLNSVPSIIVGGKYKVIRTINPQQTLDTIDQLVEKARQEQTGK